MISGDLFKSCLELFCALARCQQYDTVTLRCLRTQAQRFSLWGSGFDACEGGLDVIVLYAERLRHTILHMLSGIGETLIKIASLLGTDDNIRDTCLHIQSLREQIASVINDSSPLSDQWTDELSTSGSDTSTNGLEELLQDLQTYNTCLYDLVSVLQNPAEALRPPRSKSTFGHEYNSQNLQIVEGERKAREADIVRLKAEGSAELLNENQNKVTQERKRREDPSHDRPVAEVRQHHSSSSPSPDIPERQHTRQHRRKESTDREYETQKLLILEREKRAQAEKIAREAEIARLKAGRDDQLLNAEQVAREAEIARFRAEREAEIVRRDADKDQRRIRYEEQRRIETAERTRRRQEQEEWEIEQTCLLQEQEDRERIHAAQIQDDRQKAWNERQRRERLRQLSISRRPRHWPRVTTNLGQESSLERGDRIIADAIEAEDRRRSFQRPPEDERSKPRRRSIGEGLRRRNTISHDTEDTKGGRRF